MLSGGPTLEPSTENRTLPPNGDDQRADSTRQAALDPAVTEPIRTPSAEDGNLVPKLDDLDGHIAAFMSVLEFVFTSVVKQLQNR